MKEKQEDYTKEQSKNGRKGGLKTKELHGLTHFAKAGRKGAKKRWKKKVEVSIPEE